MESGRRGVPVPLAGVMALACLAVGVASGVVAARRQAPAGPSPSQVQDPARTGAREQAPSDPVIRSGEEVSAPGDPAAKSLAQAEAEIAGLRARIAELESRGPHQKTREEKLAIAREMIEAMRKGKRDPASFKRLLALLSELDPVMGPLFLERYLDPAEEDRRKFFDLAMAAGGQEVADWAYGQLTDPAAAPEVRTRILRTFGGGSKEIFTMANFPMNAAFTELAFQYARETEGEKRSAAAGLLGAVDTPESRAALYQLAGPGEIAVRDAAIRSLGQVGDRETLTWLDTEAALISGQTEYDQERLKAAFDAARESLARRNVK